ncbi:hypothetical protein LKV13_01015 [Borrelia sp. BU AG58]|uniref:hypothetical protein n=1 Tax=Borrelia sp. BU AG58 TaxID=2887345 RepID=UPI001E43CB92|nr:hypothetical protein [Borrelia sp. BU AG58]UER68005.1 hypothetical protein LKV13_01015 [Borrelia sp. BU AG58]
MILKEVKRIEDLTEDDIIFSNIGNLSKLSARVNDRIIKALREGNVSHIPVINNYTNIPHEKLVDMVNEELLSNEVNFLREDLIQALKDIYKPFSEKDKMFILAGKKRLINLNILMEEDPDSIYFKEIVEGSFKILPTHKVMSIQKLLLEIYNYFDLQKIRSKDSLSDAKTTKKLYLHSIRRDWNFFNEKVRISGDSVLLHAIDTTIYFLITIARLNKERAAKDAPRSSAKFFIEKGYYTQFTEFFYDNSIIIQAALGVLLHPIGLMHATILQELKDKISLKNKETEEKYKLKVENLAKSINVSKNLFRMREDISPITKMIINGQKNYLNSKNHVDMKIKKFTHELIRIFCIIDTYDEMVNPIAVREPVNPLEAVEFLFQNSAKYHWDAGESDGHLKNKKFDLEMLRIFLKILAPFDYGEILNVWTKDCNEALFKVVVFDYNMGLLPILSVIEKKDKFYNVGDVMLDLESKEIIIRSEKGEVKKSSLKNISKFELKRNIEELKSSEVSLLYH